MPFESFIPATEAAKFVGLKRRHLLALARRGIDGAYPIGTGEIRKTWVFLLSELTEAIKRSRSLPRKHQLHDQRYDRTKGGSR